MSLPARSHPDADDSAPRNAAPCITLPIHFDRIGRRQATFTVGLVTRAWCLTNAVHRDNFMETIISGTWTGHLGKGLAPRELEALLGVAQGMTAKEIARHMAISPGTVANRIENAMFKLGVHRRATLVAEAMRRQIISPLCIVLAGFIAMHAAVDNGDPMRRDRRVPERRTAQVRIVRKAEAFELHV